MDEALGMVDGHALARPGGTSIQIMLHRVEADDAHILHVDRDGTSSLDVERWWRDGDGKLGGNAMLGLDAHHIVKTQGEKVKMDPEVHDGIGTIIRLVQEISKIHRKRQLVEVIHDVHPHRRGRNLLLLLVFNIERYGVIHLCIACEATMCFP